MDLIQEFRKFRRDRKVITDSMNWKEIDDLGEVSKVVEVCWTNALSQRVVSIKSAFGVFSEVVQGRKFVAAIVYICESDCKLAIFLADGKEHLTVPNVQQLNGRNEPGQFAWFTSPHEPADDVFGVVFQADDSSVGQYWLDIDARSGRVLACTWTK
jgi:hypothetical protein